jgi:Phytanoyl-CoA dioxygenase (PhyH)
MPRKLTKAETDRFHRDGFLSPIRAFSGDEIEDRLRRLEAIESERAGRLPPAMNVKPHLLVPWLWDMVHEPRILDPVEELLGPDIVCLGSSFIAKQPGDAGYVAWHQDATYWGLSSPEAVTAWVAFTPSVVENGCVRVVPGSHREQLAHGDSGAAKNMLGRGEELIVAVDESRAVDVVLAPGEMSLHHVLIVHGSEPNRAEFRRVGFAIRYIPGRVRQTVGRFHSATIVRGRDHGHFDHEARPEGDFHPDAVARHRLIVKQGMAVIFAGAG